MMDANELKLNEEYTFITSYIVSPSEFYCQELGTCDDLSVLSENLNIIYNSLSDDELTLVPRGSNRGSLHVGQLCCAKFSDDGTWYRAKVTALFNLESVEIIFIDFGNCEKKSVSELKVLKSEFQNLPAQAHKCSLYGIHPFSGSWTEDSVNHFTNLVEDQEIISFIKKSSIINEVTMKTIESNIDVTQAMIKKGYGNDPLFKEAHSSSKKSFNKIQILCKHPYKVKIPWVKDLCNFYVNLIDENEKNFDMMMKKMNACVHQSSKIAPVVNQPCLAQSQIDSVWYRATIMVVAKNKVKVFFVDFGNEEILSTNRIKEISPEFLDVPEQGVLCHLRYGNSDSKLWSKPSQKMIDDYFDSTFNCIFYESIKGTYEVDLLKDNVNILEIFARDKLISYTAPSSIKQKIASYSFSNPIDSLMPVRVSHIDSFMRFYCQPLDKSDEMDELYETIETYYSETSPTTIDTLEIGCACIAKFSIDDHWYRAKVLSKSSDSVNVCFVDYGNSEIVPASRIRDIDPSFCKQPAYSFECYLRSVPSIYNNEIVEFFRNKVEYQDISIKIDSVHDSVACVSITVEDVDLNQTCSATVLNSHSKWEFMIPMVRELSDGFTQCFMQHFQSFEEIHVMKNSDRIQFENLQRDLQKFCNSQNSSVESIEIGKLYAAKESNGNWYRAVFNDNNNMIAHLIDIGSFVKVSMVQELKSSFYDIPRFSICCSLNTVGSDENALRAAAHLNSIVEIKLVQKAVINIVEIAINDDCKNLLDSGRVENFIEGTIHNTMPTIYQVLKIGQKVPAIISHVNSANEFFITPFNLVDELESVVEIIQERYEGNSDILANVQMNQVYIVKFSDDNSWYRGLVSNIDGNKIHVDFIDYGNAEVTSIDSIRKIENSLAKYPAFAIQCTLDLPSNHVTEKFQEIIDTLEVIDMIILDDRKDNIYQVTFEINGIDIKELLGIKSISEPVLVKQLSNLNIQSEINSLAFTSSEKEKVGILHVKSPNSFFVTPDSCKDQLQTMSDSLQGAGLENLASVSVAKAGFYYAAQFSKDEAWYRVCVTSCSGSDVWMQFIDFGNYEKSSCKNLKPLPEEFFKHSAYAIHCSLNLKLVDENEVSDYFASLTSDYSSAEVMLKRNKNNKYVVSLILDGIDVGETLVEQSSAEFPSELSVSNGSIEPPRYSTVNLNETNCEVVLLHIVSINEFYVTPSNEEENLEVLSHKMREIYLKTEQYDVKTINPSKLYAVKFSANNEWYRARVLSMIEDDIEVQFIDYGNSECTSLECFKHLLPEFTSTPAFAIHCRLIANAPNLLKKLEQFVMQYINLEVLLDKESVLTVKVDELGAFEVEHNKESEMPPSEVIGFQDNKFKDIDIIPGQSSDVTISYASHYDDFYVQLISQSEALEDLMNLMNEDCEMVNMSDVRLNFACIAKSKQDDSWYRGLVCKVEDESKVLIKYVDYGRNETLDLENILTINKDYICKLPVQAIRCKLNGVNESKLGEDLEADFLEIVSDTDKQFTVRFVERVGDSWLVDLIDMGINVANNLIKSDQQTVIVSSDVVGLSHDELEFKEVVTDSVPMCESETTLNCNGDVSEPICESETTSNCDYDGDMNEPILESETVLNIQDNKDISKNILKPETTSNCDYDGDMNEPILESETVLNSQDGKDFSKNILKPETTSNCDYDGDMNEPILESETVWNSQDDKNFSKNILKPETTSNCDYDGDMNEPILESETVLNIQDDKDFSKNILKPETTLSCDERTEICEPILEPESKSSIEDCLQSDERILESGTISEHIKQDVEKPFKPEIEKSQKLDGTLPIDSDEFEDAGDQGDFDENMMACHSQNFEGEKTIPTEDS